MGSRHTHTHNHNEERINHLIQQNHALVTQTQSLDKKLTLAQQQAIKMKKDYDAQLIVLSKQHETSIKELDSLKDPSKIEEAERKIFMNFLNQLKSFQIMNPLPKSNGYRYVAIIGENSAGKSSLFNNFLGLKLDVGVDDTTETIEKVHNDTNLKIAYFDSPGLNQTINITNASCLKAFYSIDCMIITTGTTFKNSIRSIQVMSKIKPPKLILLRNQCDKFETAADLEKCKKKDKSLMSDYGINLPILYVSAKRDNGFMDNAQFAKIMKGQ